MSQMLKKTGHSSPLKICDSVLKPQSHSQPRDEVNSQQVPGTPRHLDRRFAENLLTGPTGQEGGAWLLPARAACRSEG